MHLDSKLEVTYGSQSVAGKKAENEDCVGVSAPADHVRTYKGVVCAIADGVSAADAGREASEMCVRSFIDDYYSTPDSWSVKKAGQKVLTALNRWLFAQGLSFNQANKGYISTLSTLVIKSRTGYIFHVGDSRIYRLREGVLEQLTSDHSASIESEANYLIKAMGLTQHLEIDYFKIDIEEGDVFFLSTDGVHDFVADKIIEYSLNESKDYAATCQMLIDKALANGSGDNLTCLSLKVDSLPAGNNEEVFRELSQLPFPPELEIGLKLDGLEVIGEVHASARSQLYLVKDVETDEKFIMKTPSVNYQDDPAYIDRFIMEQWIGNRIQNKHVVNIVGEDRKKSAMYHLLEYVEGMTLADWIERSTKPSLKAVLEIFEQIVKGVRAFHRKETLHQDLKPDNIMISKEGVVKIIDFGSCHIAGINEIELPFEREKALGTVDYSAPEYKLNAKITEQVDQFSIGCILYEMLTGKAPYTEKYAKSENFKDFQKLEYVPSYYANPHIPAWFDEAIKKSVKILPQYRYETLSEFMYDLEHPNQEFLNLKQLPLIERNPTLFWKSATFIAVLLNVITLVYFLG